MNRITYLQSYINNFIQKFRSYNGNEFLIIVSGLKKFIPKDESTLEYLFDQLRKHNITIEFEGDVDSLSHIDITFKNLTKGEANIFKYQIQNLPALVELSSKTDIPIVGILIMKVVAQIISKIKVLYKAIILDLDETLWKGTLSEIGITGIRENLNSEHGAQFSAFMKFLKSLSSELGIFIAVCSRNDSKMVETTIEALEDSIFPLKGQIDFIIANNNNKSENIRKIAEQLSILPSSIVFIDDNQIVRDEVKSKLIEVFVPEWSNHYELITQITAGCFFERTELSLNSQNRRRQFKIIQAERILNPLPELSVKIIDDKNHSESIKLYSKSNQFKFSGNDDKFEVDAKSLYFEIYRENGENLGICSALTYTNSYDNFHIHNCAISCRYFEIGLEEFILMYIQKIANSSKIFINYQHSEYNQKVRELFDKYLVAFKNNGKNDKIEIVISKEIEDKMNNNTNLREL